MKISVKECADILREKDNILILTHACLLYTSDAADE